LYILKFSSKSIFKTAIKFNCILTKLLELGILFWVA
jgi:hypothetical protein